MPTFKVGQRFILNHTMWTGENTMLVETRSEIFLVSGNSDFLVYAIREGDKQTINNGIYVYYNQVTPVYIPTKKDFEVLLNGQPFPDELKQQILEYRQRNGVRAKSFAKNYGSWLRDNRKAEFDKQYEEWRATHPYYIGM